ncbi:MAG: DUF424 family protein [Thermoplasmata archaeon]|nr:DUF424 family protein [Thermoplasmata archaeon]
MKIYTVGNDVLLAACDAELVGKTLHFGDVDFVVSKEFYADVLGDEEMLKRHLELATVGNLVGKITVKCAIEVGLVDEENVIMLDGIPHAQFAII